MSLLNAENLNLNFGPKTILSGAAFMISRGERVGVIGPNGTGKSTLFRVIVGQQPLDDGRLHFARGSTIGYLPQDVLELGNPPLLASVLAAVPGKGTIEAQLAETEDALHQVADPEEQLDLAQEIADLHERIDHFELEYSGHEAERILLGLGFRTRDFERPLGEFSGGWKMRAALAGLLFKRPDLLLLDEPTNHLDMPSVLWLDEFLIKFKNTIMLISHDREIINRHVRRLLSFEVEGLRSYSGNYDEYLRLREQELEVRRAARRNQEAEIRQAEAFIKRFRAKNTKAKQVQSRIKKIEKMDLVEVDHERAAVKFSFPPTDRIGKVAVELRGISKSFGDLRLYEDLNLPVNRGDRIAIIGRNGAGKTTLLRLMASELAPDAGEIQYGSNVEIGYYAQHHSEKIDKTRSILEEVWRIVPSMSHTTVRTICGAFLFSGDEVEKSTGVLSGGELARVSLARLLVKPGNVLLMDEPTNHLDLLSSEALTEAMATFDGTLVFVSHHRSFINRLANKVWNLENGVIDVFPGNLDDYLYHMKSVEHAEPEEAAPAVAAKTSSRTPTGPEQSRRIREPRNAARPSLRPGSGQVSAVSAPKARDYQERKELNRKRSKLEKEIKEAQEGVAELEGRIAGLEVQQGILEAELAKPETYDQPDRYNRLLNDYQQTKNKIEELTRRWEFKSQELEKLQARFKALPALD